MRSFLGPTFIPEDLESVLAMRHKVRKLVNTLIKTLLFVNGFMVGIVSSFLGPAFIPEDLESVLVIAAESAEVGQHLVHELDVARGPSVADLLPTLGDHEVPGPQEAWKKKLINKVVFNIGNGTVLVRLG